LTRLVGPGLASELILTGRRVKAEEALRIGLVNALYPLDTLMEESLELAESIANNSPLAVRSAKQLIRLAFNGQTSEGLDTEAREFGHAFTTADQKEGMAAFVEKRSASFSDPS
jgi:enoyl-CoA hydratase